MSITKTVRAIYESLVPFVPAFRVIWGVTVVLGLVMLVIGLVLQRNSVGKKSPWVLAGIGLVLLFSAGIQLLVSFVSGGKA